MKLVLVATIGVGVTGGLLAWRERPEPGADPLILLLAGQCWWSATLIFRIEAATLSSKVFWVDVSWIGVAIIPIAWLLFSLEYAGYTEYTARKHILLYSIVPAITVFLGLTSHSHQLLYTNSVIMQENGIATLNRTPGIWFWIIAGYTYLLGLLGALPLLKLVTSQVDPFRGQSLALLIGLLAPCVTNVLFLMGSLPSAGVDPTPIAFAVSGLAYLGALTKFQLFGANPTPIRHARSSLFQQMQQGALVLDTHNHIVDMNERATTALQTTPSEALGRPLEQISPDLSALGSATQAGQTIYRPQGSTQSYDVSESPVTDIHDRTIGRVVTLHDVSSLLRDQQRLEVLHRAFRHNIRTNVQVILGNAAYLATHNSESKAATLQEHAVEINDLGEKVRSVINIFEQSRKERETLSLNSILDECVDSASESYPEVTFEYASGQADCAVDCLFDVVCLNIIQNAAQHNTSSDPVVAVKVEQDGEYVQVTVQDNGPGIDSNELALVEHGSETPLKHGSGFGLALVLWGTDIAGGTVDIESSDSTGTTVTLRIPVLSSE
ncbi:diguanylate cyclase [Haloarcula sp. CBA1130]|uniref:histidine kinase N-terminal 7TM domain-containing protein n=1 Tax=unclassified Haloarcula TaxID=2624677 RepID=UPI0012489670|nr:MULTISPECIES: histidine kinase N-terminal 7TM domain-containing protein [unclassified Haloarcula]KAA9396049.1 diguanylate cyclase [Haloarcula sp. CBA1129]KAA9400421.1 diguanylate cyclase [Haloarcula sp. CBA1130]